MIPLFRKWLLVAAFPMLSGMLAIAHAQSPDRQETTIDGVVFSLADGLQVEKVADQPLIKWPIVADWDAQGRLVVAESGGISRPIQEHNKQGLHKIVRLVDEDHDGKFDRRIVAAENLAFPEGVLCLGNDILVSAPPVIWKLTDSDHDGVCEDREVWFDGTTVTNCANDLHGPYLGRDGWIYWCKGAFGEQTHSLADGRTLNSSAAHIYRRHRSSTLIEPLITGGMDNPVEMAFTPEGEKFFTSTFLQHPGEGLRDGIAHAVYGGVHGKDHQVIEGHVRTGPLMPIMTQLGPAAPSGLICLETNHVVGGLPGANDARFLSAALFNLHKVTAHRLIADGASFRTEDHDLLATERVDFHPTDVIEDADGSLLVLDTGGWYDLCCPTSRIDQTTAEGGIYRITSERSRSAPRPAASPDWNAVDPEEAVSLLCDARPWVRRRAAEIVVESGDVAVASVRGIVNDRSRTLDDRLTAFWTLCQIGTEEAIAAASDQLDSEDASLVQAACHVVSVHRDHEASSKLLQLLDHSAPQVRRAAAEGLGRIGGKDSVASLLDALEESGGDRHLDHSLLYAMVEVTRRNPDIDLRKLATTDKRLHAAILVLEQQGRGSELEPSQLFVAARSANPSLSAAALEVLSAHPEWAADSIETLNGIWSRLDSDPVASDALAKIVSGWRDEQSVAKLLGGWLAKVSSASPKQQSYLAVNLHQFSTFRLRPQWSQPIGDWIEQADPDLQSALAASLAQLDLSGEEKATLVDRIVRLASQTDLPALRLELLACVPLQTRIAGRPAEQEVIAAFIEPDGRLTDLASSVLLRCKLSKPQAEQLVRSLPEIPPQHLMTAIESVHRSGVGEVEATMLDQLRQLPAARTLPRGFLTNLYKGAEKPLREQAAMTTELLESPPQDIRRAVDAMLSQLSDGDPVRGLQVFRSQRASCSGCHRMGYIGKEIGPELTRIGRSRTAEALLEAILYPSSRLEQSYQSTRVLTVDGQVHNGLLLSQSEDAVELQLNAERKIVVPRDDVEWMEPSDVSVMPQGIDQVLSRQELADLLALLQSAQ